MAGRVRGRGTTAGVVAVCAAVLGMGLTACTPEEEPTPVETTYRVIEEPSTETVTPTPTPTETPTLTPEEVNIEAAKQTVVEYVGAVDEVASEGHAAWAEKLTPYWGSPELRTNLGAAEQAASDSGVRSTGHTQVDQIEVEEHIPDVAGYDVVRLRYCADYSATTDFDAAGEQIQRTSPARLPWSVELQRQDSDAWAFTVLQPLVQESC